MRHTFWVWVGSGCFKFDKNRFLSKMIAPRPLICSKFQKKYNKQNFSRNFKFLEVPNWPKTLTWEIPLEWNRRIGNIVFSYLK